MIQYPTENMRRGRRRLEEISEVYLLEDWTWDTITSRFYLHINVNLEHSGPGIPQITEWYITATASYPFGPLNIYPSCQNGLTGTFPHQSINTAPEKNHLWYKGKLCVNLVDQTLGIRALEKEPFTIDERLFWNAQRAVQWLQTAAEGTLTKDGDFFELPEFPIAHIEKIFAFQEDGVSMMAWEDVLEHYGIAKISCKQLSSNQTMAIVHSFHSMDFQRTVYQPVWGTAIEGIEKCENALWIRLKNVPVINGWQAPVSFSDLKHICAAQDINLLDILKAFAPKARDGRSHLLLVGFPIPRRIGEEPCEMTWQALELPILSYGQYTNRGFQSGNQRRSLRTKGAAKGFRPGEAGWWINDKTNILLDSMELAWLSSENWGTRAIKGRGKLNSGISNRRIAMIGVGSLGASIAELLVRAGVTHLTCIDGDGLQIGNLCRHTLCLQNIYQAKSKSVAERLTGIDPNGHIDYVDSYLSLDENGILTPDLSNYDIIIDTTGEDQVLELLSMGNWQRNIVFCSSSVGLGAKRLYVNVQKANQPCFTAFLDLVTPYFQRDFEDCDLRELPRDGIGCWHPLFPARSDDMWLAACNTVKALEAFVDGAAEKEMSIIYEAQDTGKLFAGFQLIEAKYE